MRMLWFGLLCLMLAGAGAAYGQSWNSGLNTGTLDLQWTFDAGTYTFNVSSPVVEDRGYQVVAWALEPFNLAEPVGVVCPQGWEWRSQGGSSYFELSKTNQRYDIGSPVLEPGETLTFRYTVGASTAPVGSGGPVGSDPVFLAHVGAVNGASRAQYVPYQSQFGQTWHEAMETKPIVPAPVPEPASILVISSAFFALGCFRIKRARV